MKKHYQNLRKKFQHKILSVREFKKLFKVKVLIFLKLRNQVLSKLKLMKILRISKNQGTKYKLEIE
jgi:hypothetical protein